MTAASVKAAIEVFSLSQLKRTRRRIRREVLMRLLSGLDVAALGLASLRLLRGWRDLRHLTERVCGVRAASFNL